ncbi:unnamed protein product [Plutella xylostella]|uniref:(diamondback moth) hypothetical protein n=1 Tax=Plutella xylostella TaxID=51655 RepID=A0A8S4EM33_PLUXY|nr:unnamed protein product [Plutella xylostella]
MKGAYIHFPYQYAEAPKPIRHQTTAPLSRVGPTASLREPEPDFTAPIDNVTAPLGREAVLTCSVGDLHDYKVLVSRGSDEKQEHGDWISMMAIAKNIEFGLIHLVSGGWFQVRSGEGLMRSRNLATGSQ